MVENMYGPNGRFEVAWDAAADREFRQSLGGSKRTPGAFPMTQRGECAGTGYPEL